MANTPRKAKDPTEAAMAAIQDALKVRDAVEAKSKPAPAAPRTAAAPAAIPPAPPVTASPAMRATSSSKPADDELLDAPRAPTSEPGRPANDDWKPVGELLQSMQPRAARNTYVMAAIGSALW